MKRLCETERLKTNRKKRFTSRKAIHSNERVIPNGSLVVFLLKVNKEPFKESNIRFFLIILVRPTHVVQEVVVCTVKNPDRIVVENDQLGRNGA